MIQPILSINTSHLPKGGQKLEYWPLKGGPYTQVSISHSFFDWCFRYMMEQRREICNGKEPLKGWYLRYSDFRISNQFFRLAKRRGKIWAEIWNEGVHATQIPISGLKVRWAWKRKPEREYALRLDSHVDPCDKFFQSASRKWKEKR